MLHIPVDQEMGERARWLITLRWLIVALVAILVWVANGFVGDVLPTASLWGTLIAYACCNLAFWVAAHRLTRRAASHLSPLRLMHGQMVVDLLALTTLLHFSGGLENPFSLFYTLLVVVGSILMSKRASFLYAAAATTLWICLLVAEAAGFLPHYNLAGFRLPVRYQQWGHILAETFALGSLNFGVAYLSSSIVDRLRMSERQLYRANASCELRAAELAKLNEKLRKLDQTRSFFIRLVTHELRAPVAAIQSYLRLILDGYVPKDRSQEIIAKAEQRARDQLDLISDLLDLAYLQQPKDETAVEASDAVSVLADVLDMLQARIADKNLSIEMGVDPAVSAVMANAEHVKQIWINLISNAIKYTPEGGQLTIRLADEGDSVRGSVQDTGIGISPEEMDQLFEPFYRTEAAKAIASHSTGLGLSIVKGIVERYGGRVGVESEVGKGSTFSFELPKSP